MTDIFALHKKLLLSACPPGFESDISKAVMSEASPLCDECYMDVMGNVICRIKGKGVKKLFSAHLDSVGFMVKSVDEKGFLRVLPLGSVKPFSLVNKKVRFKNGVKGIIRLCEAEKAVKSSFSSLTFDDLYVDTGAKNREEAEKLTGEGAVCVYDGAPVKLKGGAVMTPYADDLLGCAVLISVMSLCRKAHDDLYFVFSVQEEVGCRGAAVAASTIKPDIAVVCDVAVSGDCPQTKKQNRSLSLGKGPAVKLFDASVIPQTGLSGALSKIASVEDIPLQKEISERIGTDASTIQLSGNGVCTAGVSLPIRSLHTPTEIYDLNDAYNSAKLLAAVARARLL